MPAAVAPLPPPDVEPAQAVITPAPQPPTPDFRARVAQLRPIRRGVRLRLLGRSTLNVHVANNGRTLLQMRGYGGTLRTINRRYGKRLPRKHFISSHFSPDAGHLVLADERRTLRVLRVPSARVVATITNAIRPRWINGTTLGFQRGCRAMTVRLGESPRVLGSIPAPCSEVLHTSKDMAVWIVADPGPKQHGVLREYKRVRRVDVRSGRSRVVIDTNGDGGVLLPRVSPQGNRICFARPNFKLYCASGGRTRLVWQRVRRPLRFDDTGNQLLFANRPKNHPRSRIVVVDFTAGTATITPRATREWWKFLPGGNRIVGHGGNASAVVYDLRDNWQADVGNPNSEWEGLWTVPGDPNRFAVGRERRGTRDVYLVTLPRSRR